MATTAGRPRGIAATIGGGVAAGLAGTVVMTAFQKLVEMPLTGRGDSYAPADFAQRALRVRPVTKRQRRTLNYAAHFGIGAAWGAGHATIERATGLRGPRAVAAAFGTIFTGDAILNTALGLYKPWRWSVQDWVVDVGDKLLLAAATGAVYDRLDGSRARV